MYTATNGEPATLWLKTEPIHDKASLRAFQDNFIQFQGGIQIEPLDGVPLAITGSLTSFGATMINFGQTTPTRCIHPSAPHMDDTVMLWGWEQGQMSLQASGRKLHMGAGEAMFTQAGQPETVTAHTEAQMASVSLSRAALAAMRIDVDATLLHPTQGNAAANMLIAYAKLLREHSAVCTPELRRAAALHLHDLAALAAGAVGEVAHEATGRGARAARLLAAKRQIAQTFTNAALSAADVAKRLGITPRYLHMLLEGEGTTFSTLVLGHRLALAEQLLCDPRLITRTISAIAFEVGFGDLSHFNRCFRRHFGMTPSEARERANRDLQ